MCLTPSLSSQSPLSLVFILFPVTLCYAKLLQSYPARLLSPWDSAGKNTGVGCHALLQQANLLHPGIKLFPALAGGFFTTSATCCSQIKTQWETEGRGSGSAVLPRGQSRMLEDYLCGGLRRGGGGKVMMTKSAPFGEGCCPAESPPRSYTG